MLKYLKEVLLRRVAKMVLGVVGAVAIYSSGGGGEHYFPNPMFRVIRIIIVRGVIESKAY